MPSLQENKRRSNKDLAVVRPRVSPHVGRLWDGAVTASNIAPNIAPTKTRRAPCVLLACSLRRIGRTPWLDYRFDCAAAVSGVLSPNWRAERLWNRCARFVAPANLLHTSGP